MSCCDPLANKFQNIPKLAEIGDRGERTIFFNPNDYPVAFPFDQGFEGYHLDTGRAITANLELAPGTTILWVKNTTSPGNTPANVSGQFTAEVPLGDKFVEVETATDYVLDAADYSTYNRVTKQWVAGGTLLAGTPTYIRNAATQDRYIGSLYAGWDAGAEPILPLPGPFNAVTRVLSWGEGITQLSLLGLNLTSVPSVLPTAIRSTTGMFAYSMSFAQDVSGFDTKNVTDMSGMFIACVGFNHPIETWDVGKVENFKGMFISAFAFNRPIGQWDMKSAKTIEGMFYQAGSFNQPLSAWNTSNITNMQDAFHQSGFNNDVNGWDTSNVVKMAGLFASSIFNKPLSNWDVSKVETMHYMFHMNPAFNQNISMWDTSSVDNMTLMFDGATAFNQYIAMWDVSSVSNMHRMFNGATAFNKNIGHWNVKPSAEMSFMFKGATAFNQDLSRWCVKFIPVKPEHFDTGATAWVLPRPAWDAPC